MFGKIHFAVHNKDEFKEFTMGTRIRSVESFEKGECAFEGQRKYKNGGWNR